MKEKEPDDLPSSKYEWLDYLGKCWTSIKAQNSHHLELAGEKLGMVIGYEVIRSMYPNASTDQLEATDQFYLRLPNGEGGWENVLVFVDKHLFPSSRIMGSYFTEKETINAAQ